MNATVTYEQLIEERENRKLTRRLRAFVEHAWPQVEPGTKFSDNWHVGVVCEHLEAVTSGEITRLIINIPPGCMKSLLTAVFWPAWEMATSPEMRYLFWSFDEGLTIRDSMRTHDLVTSDWYQARWPHVQYEKGQNAKLKRATTAGGWRIASSFGGKGTGEHPDRVGVDDPHNPKQAESQAERQEALKRFDSTLTTRGASRGARFVVTMQRLHQVDLTGHILARADADQWVLLSLPMRYEPIVMVEVKRPDGVVMSLPTIPGTQTPTFARRPDVDPRRGQPGALLWPQLFPEHTVKTLEAALGSYGAAGQLQQRPAPAGGGLFKREWLQIVDAAPKNARRVRGWDKAGTDAGGDWSAGVKLSEAGGIYYVEHVIRARLSSGARNALIHQTAELDGHACHIRLEQEPGSGGKESAEISVRQLAGYVVRVKPSTTDKVSRARPLAIQAEAGNVRLVRAPWNAEFIDELANFSGRDGETDDQVDAAASAFNELALGQRDVVAAVTTDNSWQRKHF